MATQLFICTKDEQHVVVTFLWAEAVSGAEITFRITLLLTVLIIVSNAFI
jgi:hypothetical protein